LAGTLPEKANRRLSPEGLAAASRVYARETAARLAAEGLRWAIGADGVPSGERAAFEQGLGVVGLYDAQAGLIDDMDRVAKALYESLEG
jgi:hypothetical protein